MPLCPAGERGGKPATDAVAGQHARPRHHSIPRLLGIRDLDDVGPAAQAGGREEEVSRLEELHRQRDVGAHCGSVDLALVGRNAAGHVEADDPRPRLIEQQNDRRRGPVERAGEAGSVQPVDHEIRSAERFSNVPQIGARKASGVCICMGECEGASSLVSQERKRVHRGSRRWALRREEERLDVSPAAAKIARDDQSVGAVPARPGENHGALCLEVREDPLRGGTAGALDERVLRGAACDGERVDPSLLGRCHDQPLARPRISRHDTSLPLCHAATISAATSAAVRPVTRTQDTPGCARNHDA